MAKSEIKTKETTASVEEFLSNIENAEKRADCRRIAEMMAEASGEKPAMWGENIIGFGRRTMKYASGRDVDWFLTGFSPRKTNLTLYLSTGEEWNEEKLARLGKHKVGMGCLYFKRLSEVDEAVLKELIEESVARAK